MPKMMIAFELLHRLFAIGELRFNDQLSVFDFRAFGSPALPVQLPIKIVGVNQRSLLKEFGFKRGFFGTVASGYRGEKQEKW